MRRIVSKEEAEKKKKRNSFLISIFILLILVVSTIGYSLLSGSNYSGQGDETIQSNGNQWIVTINGIDYLFSNLPEFVAEIPVNVSFTIDNYQGKTIYFVSNNSAINNELYSVLSNHAGGIQSACYGPCEEDLPEKDCTANLIIWRDSTENKVYQSENCIFIDGDLRAADAFLYKILGYN